MSGVRLVAFRRRAFAARPEVAALVCLLMTLPAVHAGVWGEPWGQLIWGPRPDAVPAGLHLYAPTAELSQGVGSCYGLLGHLGGPGTVASITRVVETTQTTEQCAHEGGAAAGADFALVLGAAYMVQLAGPADLGPGAPPGCPPTVLAAGANLIGIAEPTAGLGCFDLITAFGAGVVVTVERLEAAAGAFESCSTDGGSAPVGINFPIRPGEGYLVHALSASSGVNLNDLTHAACAP